LARRLVVAALLIVAGLYLALAAYVALAQGSFIFPAPPRGRAPAHADRMVTVQGGPAGSVYFVQIAPPRENGPVVVHFHGNGEDLADAGPMIDFLRSLEVGVVAVEYPGYGVSAGRPSEQALYAAAEIALRHLRVPPERIVLLGQSLGSGVAVEMAHRGLCARLALISPFTSMSDFGRRFFPWLPTGLLLRHRFDTLSKAPQIAIPVIIVHGTADEVVPFPMGERLSRAFPHAALTPIAGGGHNDLLWLHARELREALAPFLRF
jgi:pimeloyl-ACP methyl ester carboxylesterase